MAPSGSRSGTRMLRTMGRRPPGRFASTSGVSTRPPDSMVRRSVSITRARRWSSSQGAFWVDRPLRASGSISKSTINWWLAIRKFPSRSLTSTHSGNASNTDCSSARLSRSSVSNRLRSVMSMKVDSKAGRPSHVIRRACTCAWARLPSLRRMARSDWATSKAPELSS